MADRGDEGFGVDLDTYRQRHELTWAQLAVRIGAKSHRQAMGWAKGSERPQSAEALARIEAGTNREVTVWAMHRKRLLWEREQAASSRRDRFRDVA